MSWFRTTQGTLRPHRLRSALLYSAWHMGCILLLSGCLFLEAGWRPKVNEPPVIITPEIDPVFLTLYRDSHTLQVVARDPEGEPLYFIWDFPEELGAPDTFVQPGDESPLHFSSISIPRDPRYHNEEIQVLVTDGESQNPQYRTWFIAVEE